MATEVLRGVVHRPFQIGEVAVPPLENGDRLTRAEFERRYDAMPGVKNAELIEGVVYMPSPVRYKSHGDPHTQIIGWLIYYRAATPGVDTGDNVTLRLDLENEPQPDAVLRIEESRGGNSYISEDDYLAGAPELIVEIASSSVSYDLHEKLKVYRRNGIQEYLVWRVYDREIDWFRLQNKRYVAMKPDAQGVMKSRVFPGLRLNLKALLTGDLKQVFNDLQQGIEAPEHQAFVQSLKKTKQRG